MSPHIPADLATSQHDFDGTQSGADFVTSYNGAHGHSAPCTKDQWVKVRPSFTSALAPLSSLTPRALRRYATAYARLATWALDNCLGLEPSVLLSPEITEAFLAAQPAGTADLRSTLRRLGRANGVTTTTGTLGYHKRRGPAPYGASECEALLAFARNVANFERKVSLQALLALGLGCGLARESLAWCQCGQPASPRRRFLRPKRHSLRQNSHRIPGPPRRGHPRTTYRRTARPTSQEHHHRDRLVDHGPSRGSRAQPRPAACYLHLPLDRDRRAAARPNGVDGDEDVREHRTVSRPRRSCHPHLPGRVPQPRRCAIATRPLKLIEAVIDRSGVVALIEERIISYQAKSGRPRELSVKALLVALLANAQNGNLFLISVPSDLNALSVRDRNRLGVERTGRSPGARSKACTG